MKLTEREASRFWSGVTKGGTDECWSWNRYNQGGYGRFYLRKKLWLTHRVSFVIAHGREPVGVVLHRCDNPPCVNPNHLFEGTQRDNVYDCMKKMRRAHLRGEAHGRAKLTAKKVALIREMSKEFGIPNKLLADIVGVNKSQIGAILSGRAWEERCA